jgi:hypothetical protein
MAKIRIRWRDVLANEDGVKIYRSNVPIDPESLPSPIAEVAVGKGLFEDNNADAGVQHYYVAPFDGDVVGPGYAASVTAIEELPRFLYAKQQDGSVDSGTTLFVTLPDCKAGDLLVLYGLRRSAMGAIPAGWTYGPVPANQATPGTPANQWTYVMWKIAESTDPGSVVIITQASAGRLQAGVAVIRHPKGPLTVTSLGTFRAPNAAGTSWAPISYTNSGDPALVLSISSWVFGSSSSTSSFTFTNTSKFYPAHPYSVVPIDEPTQTQVRLALIMSEAGSGESVSTASTTGIATVDSRSDIHLAVRA